jgi:ribulose-5-phosphate 4-epimerase/fuculose-1-phosphate aldolase
MEVPSMPKPNQGSVDRRDFLKSAAVGAAVLVATPAAATAASSQGLLPPASSQISSHPDVTGMKEKIALATRMLVREGIIGSSGHLSMRVPGTNHVLVGPGNVSREILTADDIVTVDLDARQIEGKRRKPDETEIHCGIYRARPDVMAVAHTHPTYSVSFTITRKPILPVHMHGAIFADGVPVFDSVGHVNTRELGDGLARALGNRRAVLLKMHGAAIVGGSLEEAFVAAIQLEENAQQQLLAEATGKVEPMTPADVARCLQESWRPSSIRKRWQYYIDKQTAKA